MHSRQRPKRKPTLRFNGTMWMGPRPPKGTKCTMCERPARQYGRMGEFQRPITRKWRGNRLVWKRFPFCRIHAVSNEFGLEAYRCPNRVCARERKDFGGPSFRPRLSPEDTYVYIPVEATIPDFPDDGKPHTIPPAKVHCPWCLTLMKEVR
jgi:hypothetical protein